MKEIHFFCVLCLLLAAPAAADPEIDDMINGLVGPLLKSFSLPNMVNFGGASLSPLANVDAQPARVTVRLIPLGGSDGAGFFKQNALFRSANNPADSWPTAAGSATNMPSSTFSLVPPTSADESPDQDFLSMLQGQMRGAAAMRDAQPVFRMVARPLGRASMPSLKSLFDMPMFSGGRSSVTSIVNDGKTTRRTTVTTNENGEQTSTTTETNGPVDVQSLVKDVLSFPTDLEVSPSHENRATQNALLLM
jgi:hypothetical protein